MTDTNYTININNLHLNDPETITMPTNTELNKYKFIMGTKKNTKKEYNITRTVYHSKTNSNISAANDIIPIWELRSTSDKPIDIGRIVVSVTFNTGVNNSTKPSMLRLVGTTQLGSDLSQTVIKEADASVSPTLIGTNIYKSNFYIKGRDITSVPTTYKYIIDLNKHFKADINKFYALGFEVNEIQNTTQISFDTYVELIS